MSYGNYPKDPEVYATLLNLVKQSRVGLIRAYSEGLNIAQVGGPTTEDGRPKELRIVLWNRRDSSVDFGIHGHGSGVWQTALPVEVQRSLLLLAWTVQEPHHPLKRLALQAE